MKMGEVELNPVVQDSGWILWEVELALSKLTYDIFG